MIGIGAIVGYTYRADIYCPECVVRAVCKARGIEGHGLSYVPDEALDLVARFEGIDRTDEWTFDSGDFPKVVTDQMDTDGLCCGNCSRAV